MAENVNSRLMNDDSRLDDDLLEFIGRKRMFIGKVMVEQGDLRPRKQIWSRGRRFAAEEGG